jgi:hypothetical protein
MRICTEIIAAIVGVVVFLCLLIAWRLSAGPIQSDHFTPYLETAIESFVPDTHVHVANAVLTWDNDSRALSLHADGLQIVSTKNAAPLGAIKAIDLHLSLFSLLIGHILPKELIVDDIQISLQRTSDGSFHFGGMGSGRTGGDAHDFRDSLKKLADDLANTRVMQSVNITNTHMDVHDVATNTDWSVRVPSIRMQRVRRALAGKLALNVTQQDHNTTLDIDYIYDDIEKMHRLTTTFHGLNPAFFAGGHPGTIGLSGAEIFDLPLDGMIAFAFDRTLSLVTGKVQLKGDAGTLNAPKLWNQPRSIKNFTLDAGYDRETGKMIITKTTVDFHGPTFVLTGTGTISPEDSSQLDLIFNVQMKDWPMDQYAQLWPKPIITNARHWISEHMSRGIFSHGEASFKGVVNLDHPEDFTVTEGTGKIIATNGTINYLEGMPPVIGADAIADFNLQTMNVHISNGGIGDIHIVPFAVTMTELDKNLQFIDIPLKITGTIPSILSLIDNPPLGYANAVGLKPADITGKAEATVNFKFPLLADLDVKDIAYSATAHLSDVASTKLVEGVAMTHGDLVFVLDNQGFTVQGPLMLNNIPLHANVRQIFVASSAEKPFRTVSLTGAITAETLHTLGIDLFDGTQGAMNLSVDIKQANTKDLQVSGALDMTAAAIHSAQMNWKKPTQVPASLKFTAQKNANQQIIVSSIEGSGTGFAVHGRAVLNADTLGLQSLNLNSLIIGRTNAAVSFTRLDDDAEADGALHVDATGKSLDISGLHGGKTSEHDDAHAKEFRIDVNKLYTSENGFIDDAEGYAIRDKMGWSEISLHGKADGGHPLAVDLTLKKDGSRSFNLTCDDFGKALKGMGLTDTVRDGAITIHGASTVDNPRAIVGEVTVGSFVVGHLPALAVLMNAASPFGFAGLFSNSMSFDNLKGKFRWEGDSIRIGSMHAAGAAVGINISGKTDIATGEADLHGTMVPFSVMNSVLGAVPILGDLFTGGKGEGFFAVNYSITGNLSDPHIGVNPISLLTPGFIRNLFFDGDEDVNDEEKKIPQD